MGAVVVEIDHSRHFSFCLLKFVEVCFSFLGFGSLVLFLLFQRQERDGELE